jgi:hypothetical protein
MVLAPISVDDALSHMVEYKSVGLPGFISSIDCTHIITKQCKYNLKNNHTGTGFKSSDTTRTYNLTFNHCCRILHSTPGGPRRWNNQTMVCLDKFISSICEGNDFGDCKFELELMDIQMSKGVYGICDNGYLDWSCTVPPFTMTSLQDEIRWLKWLESMRKDVECTFGILKG